MTSIRLFRNLWLLGGHDPPAHPLHTPLGRDGGKWGRKRPLQQQFNASSLALISTLVMLGLAFGLGWGWVLHYIRVALAQDCYTRCTEPETENS